MRVATSDDEALARATAALDEGELIVLPGDLAYVVAGDALDDTAVEKIFNVTERAADRALTILLSGYGDLHHVAYGGTSAREWADAHWPGAVTIALRQRPWLPDALTAGQDEVAVTVPLQPFAREVARQFGPLAIATARRAGGPAPLDVAAAERALGSSVNLYVDGGPLPGGDAIVVRAERGSSFDR